MKKVIVITGGSDGIGKAIAQKLAPQHQVIILAPSEEKLKKVAQEINCAYEVCDVTNHDESAKAIQNILKTYSKIDCLINNAGVWIEGPIETNDPKQIHKTLEVNTLGTIYLSQLVVPAMKKAKEGLIINIISQAGLYTKKERSVYHASKWAVTGFTKALQQELSEFNIRVTGIYPGMINTNLFQKVGITKDTSISIEAIEVAKAVEFVLSFEGPVVIPELGIKNMLN